MAYRRRGRRSRRYYSYGISQRAELTYLFRGLDVEVQDIFLNMDGFQLTRLLTEYKRQHGGSAASYARRTFPKWKSGSVQMSGMVRERLLNLVPLFMSEAGRFDLIRKMRSNYIKPTSIRLEVPADSWEDEVIPAVNSVVEQSQYDNLPAEVVARARWLAAGDNQALREAIARLEAEEARIKVAQLHVEFDRIRRLLSEAENAKSVSHTIELPQGTIHVTIKRERRGAAARLLAVFSERKAMPDDSKGGDLVRRSNSGGSLARRSPNILDAAFGQMSEDQIQQLRVKAVEEKLRLDVQEKEAEQRTVNSERDVDRTIRLANELDRSIKTDYDVRSKVNTASGTTDIHIKSNKNMATVIAVVVVVIVVLLLLFR